jgi:hypothetical protein
VLVLSDQERIALLKELVIDAKKQIRNGFVLGLGGLILASLGFFSFVDSLLGFNTGWLTIGIIGAAMLAVAFYIMIHADIQEGKLKKQLGAVPRNVPLSAIKNPTPAPERSAENGDEYFDENYENWKNPFEENKE